MNISTWSSLSNDLCHRSCEGFTPIVYFIGILKVADPNMRNSTASLFALLTVLYLVAAGHRNTTSISTCTIHYTPKESGFTRERGFDVTPETRPGLQGRKFARDFLKAVESEHCGLLSSSSNNHFNYIVFKNGNWSYAETLSGTDHYPMRARKSCAVASESDIPIGTKIKLSSPLYHEALGERLWTVAEHRPGNKNEIELYWGEDDPYGPGMNITRPLSAPFVRASDVSIIFE